jgi:hypothetical protein
MTIDLILIDQQSVGNEVSIGWTLSMRKRDEKPFICVSTILEREPRSDITTITTVHFLKRLTAIIVVLWRKRESYFFGYGN